MGAQADHLSGTSVGPYTIADLIGTGGMSHVYAARDSRRQRDVAIKVVNQARSGSPDDRARLQLEARLLSRLRHPGVTGVYEIFSEAGRDFLVMELVPGATLRQVLESGPLAPADVARLGTQLADGLAAMHGARVIHRDLKPSNLKVTGAGHLKILDFGLARALPSPVSADLSTTTIIESTSGPGPHRHGLEGTIPYMAPEQLRGEHTDARSDIFSAGAVLYEMASGQPAFPQRQFACLIDAVLHEQPPDLTAVNPTVPAGLARVVTRALQKAPGDRYQSARELGAALNGLLSRTGVGAPDATRGPVFFPTGSRRRAMIGAA